VAVREGSRAQGRGLVERLVRAGGVRVALLSSRERRAVGWVCAC